MNGFVNFHEYIPYKLNSNPKYPVLNPILPRSLSDLSLKINIYFTN